MKKKIENKGKKNKKKIKKRVLPNESFYKYYNYIILILSFIFILPIDFYTGFIFRPLDSSWIYSINNAVKSNLIFGSDYVFTYGPLGFLTTRFAIYIPKIVFILYDLFIMLNILYIIYYFTKKYPSLWNLPIIVFIFLFDNLYIYDRAVLLIDGYPSNLILIFIYSIYKSTIRKDYYYSFLSAFIASLYLYIKFNYGLITSFVFIVYLFYNFIFNSKNKKMLLLYSLFFYLLTNFLMLYIFNIDIKNYIAGSLHIANSFIDSMFIPIDYDSSIFIYGWIIILGIISIFFIKFKYFFKHKNNLFFYFVILIFLYVFYKSGYTRADEHIIKNFLGYPVLLLFACSFIIWIEVKIVKNFLLILFFISSFLIIKSQEHFGSHINFILPSNYIYQLFSSSNNMNRKLNYDKNIINSKNYYYIPDSILKKIGNKTIDIIPTEINFTYFNNLNYNPRPICQSYSAYDYYLDSLNSMKYNSKKSPDIVLYSVGSIDGRYPFGDESSLKRVLLTNYKLTTWTKIPRFNLYPDSSVLFLEKREIHGRLKLVNSENIKMKLGEWCKCDTIKNNLQYLFADIEYNLQGKIKRLLISPPFLTISLRYSNNQVETYRAVVPILKTGILINKKVTSNYDAYLLFTTKGEQNEKIIEFKIESNEKGFKTENKITLKTYKLIE